MVQMFDPIFRHHFHHGLTRSIGFVATTASCDFQRRYLKELAKSKRPLPRRQEADMERFRVAGEEVTALVSHEEIESWAKGSQNEVGLKDLRMLSSAQFPTRGKQGSILIRVDINWS